MKRPTAVTLIGWLWIAFGAIFLSAMIPEFFKTGVDKFHEAEGMTKVWMSLFLGIAVVYGVFAIDAAAMFLKMRRWAWISLRIISWMGLVTIAGGHVIIVIVLIQSAADSGAGRIYAWPVAVYVSGAVAKAVEMIVYGAALIVIVKYLRSKTVREAFADEAARENP